jgi:hypothetical protein
VRCVLVQLYGAAWNGHVEAIRALVAAGAEVVLAANGDTALNVAARRGHVEAARALVEAGAEVEVNHANKDGDAENGHVEEAGAEVDHATSDGRTAALHVAAFTGLFPEIGGGSGLGIGKERTEAMARSFGGRVSDLLRPSAQLGTPMKCLRIVVSLHEHPLLRNASAKAASQHRRLSRLILIGVCPRRLMHARWERVSPPRRWRPCA